MGRFNWGDSYTDQQFINAYNRFINDIKSIEAPLLAKSHPNPDHWALLTALMIMERQSRLLNMDNDELQGFASYMLTIAASMLIERGFPNAEILDTLQLDMEDLIKLRHLVNKHRK